MSKSLLILVFIALGNFAQAETFYCMGTGRFSGMFKSGTISLQWPNNSQSVLVDTTTANSGTKILVDIDKSNSDGTAYLSISVLDMDLGTKVFDHIAKGSIKDEVIYAEQKGTEQINGSAVTCLPVSAPN